RFLRYEVAIERQYRAHVGSFIFSGVKQRTEHDAPIGIVQCSQKDGNACSASDMVEAGLPALDLLACTLRRQYQDELATLAERLNRLLHGIQLEVSLYRYSSQAAHQAAPWPAEDAVLAEPARTQSQHQLEGDEQDEIPIGSVVGADDDELVDCRKLSLYAPAHG